MNPTNIYIELLISIFSSIKQSILCSSFYLVILLFKVNINLKSFQRFCIGRIHMFYENFKELDSKACNIISYAL